MGPRCFHRGSTPGPWSIQRRCATPETLDDIQEGTEVVQTSSRSGLFSMLNGTLEQVSCGHVLVKLLQRELRGVEKGSRQEKYDCVLRCQRWRADI